MTALVRPGALLAALAWTLGVATVASADEPPAASASPTEPPPAAPAAPATPSSPPAPKEAPAAPTLASAKTSEGAAKASADAPRDTELVRPGCPSDSTEERCQTRAHDPKLRFDPGLTVYAQYGLALRDEAGKTKWFHEFELTRAHAWLGASWGDAHARVLLEAVRSASEGALLGVAGDSFVARVREAYAGYRFFQYVDLRAGLLPTLTIPVVERSWGMRAVNASGFERTGFGSPADLGVTVVGSFPKGFGFVGVGGYNGEGYTRRELNRGKNVEIAAEVHPLAHLPVARPLAVFGSYMSGSSGTGSARANRIHAGLAWQGGLVRGGAAFGYAMGVGDEGARNAFEVDSFVKVTPIDLLLLGADVTYWKRDTRVATDQVVLVTATVGVRPLWPFAGYFAFDRQIFGAAAKAALPGQDTYRFRLIAAMELQ
jgi:hypothetical protein